MQGASAQLIQGSTLGLAYFQENDYFKPVFVLRVKSWFDRGVTCHTFKQLLMQGESAVSMFILFYLLRVSKPLSRDYRPITVGLVYAVVKRAIRNVGTLGSKVFIFHV